MLKVPLLLLIISSKFGTGICVNNAFAKIDDDILAEAQSILKKIKPSDASSWPTGLDPENTNRDPDKIDEESVLPLSMSSIAQVVIHHGEGTNPMENLGIKNYMTDALASNDKFYEFAFRFYKSLKKDDADHLAREVVVAGVPIQIPSKKDYYKIALGLTGDPYLALKTLAVYGHDNEAFALGKYTQHDSANLARLHVLDEYRPPFNSYLYLSGAIGGLNYTSQQIEAGKKIAQDCKNTVEILFKRYSDEPFKKAFSGSISSLCNDDHDDYQADYYHVITSAFLACRRTIAEKHQKPSLLSSMLDPTKVDKLYLLGVEKNKIRSFRAFINDRKGDVDLYHAKLPEGDSVRFKRLLEFIEMGLNRVENHQKLAVLPRNQIKPGMSQKEYDFARAAINRFEFEVKFRVAQHNLGLRFGREVCKNTMSFNGVSNANNSFLIGIEKEKKPAATTVR